MGSPNWTAPPTRREFTFILFSLVVFVISFNLDPTLRVIGFQPNSSLQKFGLGSDPGFDSDGRRPEAYRDHLENLIFGDWAWEEGLVAGVDSKTLKNQNASFWDANGPVVHNEFVKWEDGMQTSELVAHVPGYTIIDSLVILKGTFYIITDNHSHWPSLDIISSKNWRMISTEEAKNLFLFAGSVHGVTLLSMDDSAHQDSHTLPSLWRMYSSLDPFITSIGTTILPPPSRLSFPQIHTFVEQQLDDESITLTRSHVGFYPQLLKTMFPSTGVMYAEDWEDLKKLEVPFIMERAVIADREASTRGLSRQANEAPDWTAPFLAVNASKNWWEPVRTSLTRNLYVDDMDEVVVTYITRQDEDWGPRLRDGDHAALVQELQRLEKESSCKINIVSNSTRWVDMMTMILKSTIVLGVYGEQLFDGIFMKPSPRSTLMEFWPSGTFTVDRELPVQSVGLKYMAWWEDRVFHGDSLPPTLPPVDARKFQQDVLIDSRAVVQKIRDILR